MSGDKVARVPEWNGLSDGFEVYKEEVKWFVESTKYQDRYLCGPRLVRGLSGAAKAAVENKREGWLSKPNGAAILVAYLHRKVCKAALPDLGRHLDGYLFKLRRRRGEAMSSWCWRSRTAYDNLRRALQRIKASKEEFKQGVIKNQTKTGSTGRSSHANYDEVPSVSLYETFGKESWGSKWATDEWRSWRSGEWQEQHDSWKGKSWSQTAGSEEDESDGEAGIVMPELLPAEVQGWLLLGRSGLNPQERAAILGSCGNRLGVPELETALKTQWSEDDVVARDSMKNMHKYDSHHHNYMASVSEDARTWESEEEEAESEDEEGFVETLDEEANAAFSALKENVETAAVTLREARKNMKEFKLSRRYYDKKKMNGKGGGKGGGKGLGPCFRCGGPHQQKDCPDKGDPKLSKPGTQTSFMVFAASIEKDEEITEKESYYSVEKFEKFEKFADMDENMNGLQNKKKNKKVEKFVLDKKEIQVDDEEFFDCDEEVETSFVIGEEVAMVLEQTQSQGKAIIDCGATNSIGGITALETLANLRQEQGEGRIMVDISETARPTYKFGNGDRKRVLSQASIPIQVGANTALFKCHALEADVPILASIRALRSLKAVIDFDSDEAIFKVIDPTRIIKLERAPSGHLLLDLSKDLMQQQGQRQSHGKDAMALLSVSERTEGVPSDVGLECMFSLNSKQREVGQGKTISQQGQPNTYTRQACKDTETTGIWYESEEHGNKVWRWTTQKAECQSGSHDKGSSTYRGKGICVNGYQGGEHGAPTHHGAGIPAQQSRGDQVAGDPGSAVRPVGHGDRTQGRAGGNQERTEGEHQWRSGEADGEDEETTDAPGGRRYGAATDRQRDHGPDLDQGKGIHQHAEGKGSGQHQWRHRGELRQASGQDVRDDLQQPHGQHHVGHHDHQGGSISASRACEVGSMGRVPECHEAEQEGEDRALQHEFQQQRVQERRSFRRGEWINDGGTKDKGKGKAEEGRRWGNRRPGYSCGRGGDRSSEIPGHGHEGPRIYLVEADVAGRQGDAAGDQGVRDQERRSGQLRDALNKKGEVSEWAEMTNQQWQQVTAGLQSIHDSMMALIAE